MRRVVSLLLLALSFAGCEEKLRPSIVTLPPTDIPDQESWRSTVMFSDSGKIKAILWAGHISMYANQGYTLLGESVHVDFYDEFEKHSSTLTALRGKVNDRTQDLEAYENVVVTSDSGTTLESDRLFWDNGRRKIHTDAFVHIVSPTDEIRGQGLVSDQGLKNYRIAKVTGRAVTNE
jgi:LPS export ABC transporter protein LptC